MKRLVLSRPSRRLLSRAVWCALAASLVLFPQSQAGFDYPKGVPDNQLQNDGEVIGGAGRCPPGTLAKLKSTFGLNDADAKAKLIAIRANIQKAIDLVKAQDAALGKCLQDALNCERLCVDFVSKDANATALPDGTTDCAKDPINIGISNVSCTELAVHDPGFYQLFTSLMHEAKHATQDYSAAAQPGDNDCKKKVRKRKQDACNEIAAEELENTVIDALTGPLEQIKMGNNPPSPAGAAGKIVDSIKALPMADRAAAADALLKKLAPIKDFNDQHIACENARKAAFDALLASAATAADKTAMNDALKLTKWYATYNFRGQFDVVRDPVFYGGGGTSNFTQSGVLRTETINTGLANTTDLEVLTGGHKIIVAGTNFAGDCVLLGYEDLDNDGYVEALTRQVLLTAPLLRGGIDTTIDPASGDVFIFPSESNLIYRTGDLNSDGFPDFVLPSPVIAPNPLMDDVEYLSPSADGRVLYGQRGLGIEDETFLPEDSIVVMSDFDQDGFFETVEEVNHFEGAVFTPNFVIPPVVGAQTAVLFASYQANVQVVRVNAEGIPLEPLGFGQPEPDGNLTINLFRPLMAGELVAVFDFANNISSLPTTVGVIPPHLGIVRQGNFAVIFFETHPGVIYQVQTKNSLLAPTWIPFTTIPGTGGSVQIQAPINSPMKFFRVELQLQLQ